MDADKKRQKLYNMIKEELPSLVSLTQSGYDKKLTGALSVDIINLQDFAFQANEIIQSLKEEGESLFKERE